MRKERIFVFPKFRMNFILFVFQNKPTNWVKFENITKKKITLNYY